MLYGYTPFGGKTMQKTFANILHKDFKFPKSKEVCLQAKQLIDRLLHRDSKSRLWSVEGANEVKEHPFFRGVNWALVRCMCSLYQRWNQGRLQQSLNFMQCKHRFYVLGGSQLIHTLLPFWDGKRDTER